MAKKTAEQPINMVKSDRDWRAEDDARTLSSAHEVMSDHRRHRKAIKAAKGIAQEREKEAQAMHRVANNKPITKSQFKGTVKVKW